MAGSARCSSGGNDSRSDIENRDDGLAGNSAAVDLAGWEPAEWLACRGDCRWDGRGGWERAECSDARWQADAFLADGHRVLELVGSSAADRSGGLVD